MTQHILGIDRWSKYIGVATLQEGQQIPMPLGYLDNNGDTYFKIGEIIAQYRVSCIVMGYPKRQKNVQEKIDKFIKSLSFIIDPMMTTITKIDEDYSTVQAGEIISNFKKNVATDTVSAMVLLDRYRKTQE